MFISAAAGFSATALFFYLGASEFTANPKKAAAAEALYKIY